MRKILLSSLFVLLSSILVFGKEAGKSKMVTGQRRYDLIVEQSDTTMAFNRGLEQARRNIGKVDQRGIFGDIAGAYASLGTSLLLGASQNLISAGISLITEAVRDKRPDWEKATKGECTFVKHLPSQTEILDFYDSVSTVGAIDPKGMKFRSFGCRQYITIVDSEGKEHNEDVFYLSCRLRDDAQGMDRIARHSKFEVVVDSLVFNPYLCNLPNDTLSVDTATQIGFDFRKRKNLEFKVVATLTSSWINEAIQVAKDVELGKFVITARIDSLQLNDNKVFTYKYGNPADKNKVVSVVGESFIVPRSYSGYSADGITQNWGTGQYRVNMDIVETCQIREDFYKTKEGKKEKWNKEWKKEWEKMKKRPTRGGGAKFMDIAFPQLTGNRWISTFIEPVTVQLIQYEGRYVNAATSELMSKIGAKPSAPTTGTSSNKGK